MVTRRYFIKETFKYLGLSAISLNILDDFLFPRLAAAQTGGASLRKRAADKGLFYGAASFKRILSSDPGFATKFTEECGMLAPDWELKWKPLRPTPTSYDFESFDWLIDFATKNRMLFRGHTLVWHEDLPPWFSNTVNSSNAKQFLSDHISTVVKRHAGKMHSWDVVNEPIAMWDKHPDGLRTSSQWHKLLGPDYIDFAFRTAAKADPKAMLVLNQNRIEQERPGDDETRAAVLKLLTRLKASGTPIHALGIESHLGQKDASFNKSKFRSFLKKVADLDLKIIITEMDVADSHLPSDIPARDRIIGNLYEDFLTVALSEPAVIGVITWGLSDKYTWLSKYAKRQDEMPVRPLPLDQDFHRKPAWNAIARAFDNAPKR
jgi:endo-1,4-beta-xylanase